VQLGEAFVGEAANAAHVNTVLGPRDGPVGTAWATALATPTSGHAPFVVVLKPGVPVKPFTLFVNKAGVESNRHAALTWGAAQAGVAAGVADAVAAGVVTDVDTVLIVAVWVNPAADNSEKVFANNRQATHDALAMGAAGGPDASAVEAARTSPSNPFFAPRQ
jgi:5,6,7,8-tetrahydromethanopterin hydro-lyase